MPPQATPFPLWHPAHLPARLTELLHINSAAQGDKEEWKALSWQAVVADHSIQHLQGDLGCPWGSRQVTAPQSQGHPVLTQDHRQRASKQPLTSMSTGDTVWTQRRQIMLWGKCQHQGDPTAEGDSPGTEPQPMA